jgi:ribosomal protein S27AE
VRNPKNVAIVSSGDVEKDAAAIEKFCRESDLIDAGMCPNGCGGMMAIDTHNAECPKCHFVYFCSGGLKTDRIPKC